MESPRFALTALLAAALVSPQQTDPEDPALQHLWQQAAEAVPGGPVMRLGGVVGKKGRWVSVEILPTYGKAGQSITAEWIYFAWSELERAERLIEEDPAGLLPD